jgi:hypothetical protein
MTRLNWGAFGDNSPNVPTDTMELKSTACWVCGEVKTFSAVLPLAPSANFSTTRDVKCASCAVGWRVVIRSVDGQIVVEEVYPP